MTPEIHRYEFASSVPLAEVEATLTLSLLAAEGLHSQSRLALEAAYTIDAEDGTIVIEAKGRAGQDLNRLFTGFLTREFGPSGFRVERLPNVRRRQPVAAK
jgi:hypothetical protein